MTKNNEEKLGTEKIGKLMLQMGMPGMVAQLINLLYNIVDRGYIGHIAGVGAQALTGVGLSLPIIVIIGAFSGFVGGGGAPLAAIALGEGNREKAEKILGNGLFMLIIFSAAMMGLFYWIKQPFLYLIGASDVTYQYANQYIEIYLLGTVFTLITMGLNSFITAQGNSKTAMLSILIGAVTNIILDPILIFGCSMGVRGAAIATVFSQALGAIWVLRFLMGKKATLKLKRCYIKFDKDITKHTAALGVSPFIMQSTEALISITMNSGLQKYGGDMYVGSLTILQSVMQMINLPANGFSQGCMPIISYNYGAGNMERVQSTYKRLMGLLWSIAAAIGLLAILKPGIFAILFTNDRDLIALVEKVLPIFICGTLIFGLQVACQTTFMALGQAKISLFIALLRKVFLLIPLAVLLPKITNSVMGIYYAEPISDFTAGITCGILFLLNIKKILAHHQKEIKK